MNHCECGCGTVIADDKRFVRGHAARTPEHPFYGGYMKGKKFSPEHKISMSAVRTGKSLNFPSTTIDWHPLITAYNNKYGTNFKNEEELYLGLYPKLSPQQISRQLRVSCGTVYKRMDFYGIERNHKQGGANNTTSPARDAFLAIPEGTMNDMTAKMLAVRLGVHITTIYKFASETGRVFRRRAANRVKGEQK